MARRTRPLVRETTPSEKENDMDRLTTRTLLVTAMAAVLVLALVGCTGTGTSGTGGGSTGSGGTTSTNTVVEKNFQFSPADLTVQVGDTVTFDNQDTVAHHVFVGATDLGQQEPGQKVTWTASANGAFAVKCVIHPSMTGQITVGTGGGASTAPSAPPAGSSAPTTYGY
jgi:plastocyanin